MSIARAFAVALTALGAWLSTGDEARAQKPPITIGLAVANLQADFFRQIKASVERAGREANVLVITVDARGDSAAQISQVRDLIAQKIDALIYIPAGTTAAAVPVNLARAAGIPTVAVDRNAEGAPADTFIASDSVAGAHALGRWVVEQTGGTAEIGIILGQIGTTPQLERDKGFGTAIAGHPGMRVVVSQASLEWHQDEGFAIAQDMLQRRPTITVLFGQADALALGAAQAVKVIKPGHRVLVVGFDGDVTGLKAVQNGTVDATMTQPTQEMGRIALRSALDLIARKPVQALQLQAATLTTKANVDAFIDNHP
jgi:ribose transport system substrate-binding protein